MFFKSFLLLSMVIFSLNLWASNASGFNVSDIEAKIHAKEKAKQEKIAREKKRQERLRKYRETQLKNIKKAFKKIEYINSKDIDTKIKKEANRRFLRAFAKDMEWTKEDDILRKRVKGYFHLTTYDKTTGLLWQDNRDVLKKKIKWEDAKKYCKNLTIGKISGFRLPTVKELSNIAKRGILINSEAKIKNYWSSDELNAKVARYVYDAQGDISWGLKSEPNYVRCVKQRQGEGNRLFKGSDYNLSIFFNLGLIEKEVIKLKV